jgi:hypothetical protein
MHAAELVLCVNSDGLALLVAAARARNEEACGIRRQRFALNVGVYDRFALSMICENYRCRSYCVHRLYFEFVKWRVNLTMQFCRHLDYVHVGQGYIYIYMYIYTYIYICMYMYRKNSFYIRL